MRARRWIAIGVAAGVVATALLRGRHRTSMLYPPLDVPKPFAPEVWLVDGAIGPGVPVRMTVVRLADGGLLLHSPTRFHPELRRALERLGPIRFLVAPNSVHWVFVREWHDVVPDALLYAAPGLRRRRAVRRAGLRIDHDLGDAAPPAWAGQIDQAVVPGGAGFREVAMFHRASGTLLMTDLMQNFEMERLPPVLRPIAWALGNAAPWSRAPGHLRAVMLLRRRDAAEAARRIVAWAPERIVVTHGAPIETEAPDRLRRSFRWLTG